MHAGPTATPAPRRNPQVSLAEVIWAQEALVHLEEIYAWAAGDKPGAAGRLAKRLLAAGDSLADFLARGREISAGMRQLTQLAPYLIRYSYDAAAKLVIIRAVWHGAREPP